MNKSLTQYIFKKTIVILIVSILFSILFYSLSFVFSNKYKTEIYGYSHFYTTPYNKSNVKIINNYLDQMKFEDLAKEMNIDIEKISKLKKIIYFDIVSKGASQFNISIISSENNYFKEYTEGIEYFFNNYGSNKALIESEKRRLENLIAFKANEIKQINVAFELREGENFNNNLFLARNKIKNELERNKMDLAQINSLTIINEPLKPTNPYFPNKRLFSILGFLFGFLLSSILVVIRNEMLKSEK